ncbi:glycosyltransferase [Hydromonas duriensis]|nr:glycosyltransferase [Hydromonas duriensis]
MYTSGLFINLYCKRFDVKRDYSYKPTASVILSCFNEGHTVYETIKSLRMSDYPQDKLQILAFDDCSKDDSFEWIKKAAQDFPNVVATLNERNKGKAHTFLDGLDLSTAEVVVGVDSDCIFDEHAISELMACFTEPNICAVGGRVGISNADETWLTRCQAVYYALSFLVLKSPEKLFRKVQCLSGPLVAIKRECFDAVREQVEKRNFLGIRVTNGEDRALTQILLRNGYSTYLNTDAVCWTAVPSNISGYLSQQLRWRRSAVGQWLDALARFPIMFKNNTFLCAFFSLMPIFVMFSWNVLFITSGLMGHLLIVLIKILLFHMLLSPILALAFFYMSKHHLKRERVASIGVLTWSLIIMSLWFPFSALFVTLFALSTLDDGGWVTRA